MSGIIVSIDKYSDLLGAGSEFSFTDVKTQDDALEFFNILNSYDKIILYGLFELEREYKFNKMTVEEKDSKISCLNFFMSDAKINEKTRGTISSNRLCSRSIFVEEVLSFMKTLKRYKKTGPWIKEHLNSVVISYVELNNYNFELLFRVPIENFDVLYIV
ncbi:MAG: hypothetical protein DRJ01_02155 [Bacteroidetes bacterium]|nr:MAG: hypothetical protein DRJ01_02155 [Bacteroidota bacterium]